MFKDYLCKKILSKNSKLYNVYDSQTCYLFGNGYSLKYINLKKFKCEVGYSGHESTVSPSIYAWYLGASVIERHITLDRSMWGTDQSASLSEDGIKNLTDVLKKSQYIFGNGKKVFSKKERELSKKFRYWEN